MRLLWLVQITPETSQSVAADRCEIVAGALVFYRREDLILAFAPGEWTTVTEDQT